MGDIGIEEKRLDSIICVDSEACNYVDYCNIICFSDNNQQRYLGNMATRKVH